jgi:hypothetical protein
VKKPSLLRELHRLQSDERSVPAANESRDVYEPNLVDLSLPLSHDGHEGWLPWLATFQRTSNISSRFNRSVSELLKTIEAAHGALVLIVQANETSLTR